MSKKTTHILILDNKSVKLLDRFFVFESIKLYLWIRNSYVWMKIFDVFNLINFTSSLYITASTHALITDEKWQKIIEEFRIGILPNNFGIEFTSEFNKLQNLTEEDSAILSASLKLISVSQKPLLLTSNESLIQAAKAIKVKTSGDTNFLYIFLKIILSNVNITKSLFILLFYISLSSFSNIESFLKFIEETKNIISGISSNPTIQFSLIAILGLFLGTILFAIREKFRNHYGVGEIFFGLSSIEWAYHQYGLTSVTNLLIAGMAGLYIIVRGWDNIMKYYDKGNAGKLLNKFSLWLKNEKE